MALLGHMSIGIVPVILMGVVSASLMADAVVAGVGSLGDPTDENMTSSRSSVISFKNPPVGDTSVGACVPQEAPADDRRTEGLTCEGAGGATYQMGSGALKSWGSSASVFVSIFSSAAAVLLVGEVVFVLIVLTLRGVFVMVAASSCGEAGNSIAAAAATALTGSL